MQFTISTSLVTLALAALAAAAPAAGAAPSGEVDWKVKYGWDGKVTPIEEIGEVVGKRDVVPDSGLGKRALGAIYICPANDWKSEGNVGCSNVKFSYVNQCIRLSDQYYRYTLSSIGPDPGTWCVLYHSTDCSHGGSDGFSYPGLSRLSGYWAPWNDNTGSIKCWW